MSQISVLGFWSSSASFSSSSSGPSDHTHWAILISPHPPSAKPQKPKSKVKSKPRFFHSKITEPLSDSALFDMNKHQLRQQEFPIPLKEDADEADEADAPTSSPATSSEVLSITTLNADTSHPLQLTMRISASILADEPQRLIPKLSHRLYNTPTYGPEDDWLRAALSAMHDGFLEPDSTWTSSSSTPSRRPGTTQCMKGPRKTKPLGQRREPTSTTTPSSPSTTPPTFPKTRRSKPCLIDHHNHNHHHNS